MIDFLETQFIKNPNLQALDLSKQGVKSLAPLMGILLKMKNLKNIDLSENELTEIPEAFSGLTSLQEVNISGNELNERAIEILGKLPKLVSLYINLNTEEDVERVIIGLQSLEVLNGLEIDRDELKKGGADEQDVEDDQEQIIEDQEEEDEAPSSQNPLATENIQPVQVNQQEEESKESTIQINQGRDNREEGEESLEYGDENRGSNIPMVGGISQREFEEIAIVFDSIRGLCGQFQPQKDAELEKEYEEHLARSLEDIQKEPQNRKKSLLVKLSFYDLCAKHFLSFLNLKDAGAAAVYQNLQNSMNRTFAELLTIVGDSAATQPLPPPSVNNRAAEERRIKALEELVQLYSSEKEEMKKQLEALEAENKRLIDHMVRHSKTGGSSAGMPRVTRDGGTRITEGDTNSEGQRDDRPIHGNRKFMKNVALTGSIGPTGQRTLSLRQLKEVIADIYAQKTKFDQKCEEGQLPRETMQQFMYTYLNQRYGLKNLIIEWATAIINGIRRFSRSDHDVALFGKIMRNECDQEFRFIQLHVKETLSSLVRAYMKQKYPIKSEREIARLVEKVESGSIDDWLWKRVIDKMYDAQDCATLEKACVDLKRSAAFLETEKGRKLTREEQGALLSKRQESKLLFKDFQKAVLDFQLREHEKFLKRFVEIFRDIDTDSNGLLSEQEFRELVGHMGLNPDDANYFLQIIDPYNHKQMTFSEIVHLFSSVSPN